VADDQVSDFASLGLRPEIVKTLTALGYEEPTPVQREAIPLLIAGRDVLGQAETGTGKTAAFALPMLQRIAGSSISRRRPAGLVLVPTRELAMQVAEALHKYGKALRLTVVPVYGGSSMSQQIRALDRGTAVVVATPGRALDHIRRGTLSLESIEMLVLDEADEMLDMGFADDLEAILEGMPEEKQTALFAATMPARIEAIAKRHLREPARVTIAREKRAAGAAPRVRQVAYIVSRLHKPAALTRVLEMEDPTSAIVFCRTRLEVESLTETLNAHGLRAKALHGGLQQVQRDRVMNEVRSGKADLLVATDVAARGLDIDRITHVVNYDVPASPETYVHRIGRTGRAGRTGTALTFAEPREHRLLRMLAAYTKQKIDIESVPTAVDMRARRLEQTRASVRERLVAGELDDVRVVVEALATEFDVVDIAAAAIKLLHAAEGGDEAEVDIPAPFVPAEGAPRKPGRERPGGRGPGGPGDSRPGGRSGGRWESGSRFAPLPGQRPMGRAGDRRRAEGPDSFVRLQIGAGRRAGVRPGDLVGAITGEAGIDSREVGAIEIGDRYSLVEVSAPMADRVIEALRRSAIRGQRVTVKRERGEGE
jgi:ATP-dependent RNA helicase DeaD